MKVTERHSGRENREHDLSFRQEGEKKLTLAVTKCLTFHKALITANLPRLG